MSRQKGASKATVQKQARQVQALKLRQAGLHYYQIAQKMGVVTSTAFRLVTEALVATIQEPADAVRALEMERLDRLTQVLEKRIKDGKDDKAISSYMKVMDHRAKILGLYAPVTIQGPDGAPLRFVVELPPQAPTLADWQAQAAAVIDVTPQEALHG